jgi:predicted CXXCH cytochrome family protein
MNADARALGRQLTAFFGTVLMTALMHMSASARLAAQISPGPLARAHRTLEGAQNCVSCHGLKRQPMTQVCLACHKEIGWLMQQRRGLHAREVTVGKKECASCHPDHAGADFDMVAWPEGAAARFDHRRAGWALDGKHAEAKCESCHDAKYRVGEAATLSRRSAPSGAGWVGLERTCISCHKSDDVHDGKLAAACEGCHTTQRWDDAPKFDHDQADYRLDGAHVEVACDKCHLTARLAVRRTDSGERIPVFKPVPYRECSSCHEDPHKGRLSAECSDCHVTRGFDQIDRRDFNHSRTRYPLKGKHAAVGCAACHGPDLARTKVAFATCGACHADAHNGEATLNGKATDCASCHSVAGFTPSTFTANQHAATRYPLEGKHRNAQCSGCHTPGPTPRGAGKRSNVRLHPTAARCGDCHDDAHARQLASREGGGTCESCHVTAGFSPSTYARATHATLRLPLDGRHGAITCAACHGLSRPGLPPWPAGLDAGSARFVFPIADASCTACHADPHQGRYVATATSGKIACASCHDATAFRPSTVSVAAHASYAFPLEGAHRAVPCAGCHDELNGRRASSTLLLNAKGIASLPFSAATARSCASCHDTPHGPQFAGRKGGDGCAACHDAETFAPASRFSHERDTPFRLAGAHATVPCAKCHLSERLPSGGTRVVYRPLSAKCESCHDGRQKGGPA